MVGTSSSVLLELRDLRVHFGSPARPVRAVDGVSLRIGEGEIVALVGESGCGKSATALSLTDLLPHPPAVRAGGEVIFNGSQNPPRRGRDVAYVFQEPAASLNPVQRVGSQIGEVIRLHRPGASVREETVRLLGSVGIPEPDLRRKFYPHQLSGGQQQRVMIAMALAGEPRLLVADEPTTALDVTVQLQILELLQSLRRKLNMAVLLITHNLGIVADVADRVYVMYAGRVVESGRTVSVLRTPKHPYTKALLEAVPSLSGMKKKLKGIEGMVPSLADLPAGCKFHPRCPIAQALCREVEPKLESAGENQEVRCHFWR